MHPKIECLQKNFLINIKNNAKLKIIIFKIYIQDNYYFKNPIKNKYFY